MSNIDPPAHPTFEPQAIEFCRRNKDAFPMVFGWACYVVRVCRMLVPLPQESAAAAKLPRTHFLAVSGLILRCSNLAEATLRLAVDNDHGDGIRILARSVSESAVKAMWLATGDATRFQRYMADSIKAELELCSRAEANIAARGWALPIEKQLLSATRRSIELTGLTHAEINTAKKLPDLATMYEDVGIGRLSYVTGHKLDSHATHGTWMELVVNYLGEGHEGIGLDMSPVKPDPRSLFDTFMAIVESLDTVIVNLHDTTDGRTILAYVRAAEQGLFDSMAVAYPQDFGWAADEVRRRRSHNEEE
jgi:hypothetical protein